MVFKKKRKTRKAMPLRRRRVSARKANPRRRRKGVFSNGETMNLMLGGGAYGAFRQQITNFMQPLTVRLPVMKYTDELVLLGTGYFMAKGKIPFIKGFKFSRTLGKAMVVLESARIGGDLWGNIGNGRNGGLQF